jgi:predicted ATPase
LRLQCSPHHTNSALYPVINQLQVAAGFAVGDSPSKRLAKLKQLLAQRGQTEESATGLLASLLSIPAVDGFEPPELSPPVFKERTFEALIEQLTTSARHNPLVFELEDAHWIDPTTLEFMTQVIEHLRELPAMVIVTYRPQFACPWTEQAHAKTINLNSLTSNESRAMIMELCHGRSIPPAVLEQIVAKTDGVPLFVEELTKNVLESGLLVETNGRLELARELSSLSIPASLQDSLMARLDRLGPVKRLAQVGAAIGREFSRDLIEAAAGMEGRALERALDELAESELVFRSGDSESVSYTFKHALIQDAAYASLLKSRRQSLHVQLAEVFAERFPETFQSHPEVLARHWREGGRPDKAVRYWLAAGKQASRRFSNQEALSHLESGLEMIGKLPGGESRDDTELKLRVALGTVLRVSAGPGAKTTQDNYDKAVTLCDRLPESPEQFAAMWGKWVNAMNFKLELGLQWTDRLERLASKLDDSGFNLQAHHAQWTTLFHIGRFAEAFSHIERGLRFYDAEKHRHHASLYGGHDPKVCGLGFAAHALWMLGSFERSLSYAKRCAEWGGNLDHVGSSLHVIEAHLLLYQFRNEPDHLEPWLDRLDSICGENDLPEYRGKLNFNRGWLIATRSDTEKGIAMMRQGLENQRGVGSFEDVPMFSERLAAALAASGRHDEALNLTDQALLIAEDFSLRYWLAEVHRRKGSLLAQSGQRDAATASFRRAKEIAREQGAIILELRAAMSMARHAADNGTSDMELDELGRLIDVFPEGTNCVDLHEAQTLYALRQSTR